MSPHLRARVWRRLEAANPLLVRDLLGGVIVAISDPPPAVRPGVQIVLGPNIRTRRDNDPPYEGLILGVLTNERKSRVVRDVPGTEGAELFGDDPLK